MHMRMYDYLVPSVNFMGANSVSVVGERCKILGGKKALIVTDKFLKDMEGGAVELTVKYLKEAGLDVVYYDGVEPNPKDVNVIEGLKIFKEENCDMIVTVGGGSSHDCGKGIGIAATHEGDLYDYAGIETLVNPLPPIVAVNTTAGTASELTRHCVLTNTKKKIKFVIVSWRNLPLVSINDPMLMVKKPAGLTAATGMDALTHAIEAYVSKDANPVTDASAIQAIKLISQNLRQAVALGENLEARENMAYASLLAGMAFNNANLGYVHAMAHQLGGLYDMAHGVANAMLLPHVERYNMISNPKKFADIAEFMGENISGLSVMEAAEKAINAMFRLSEDVGIPKSLKEMGVKQEDFEHMAELALLDGNAFSNPRKGNAKDIFRFFFSLDSCKKE
ncbi:iron-containing alcohol dehydrogenase [Clostridium butyricum]|nr:iron-containing alcohol dehydrogenase [Clostridium butyricum]MDI9210298.1 iron-containing alcohol dehydrogenase [Clostridium butyricum]